MFKEMSHRILSAAHNLGYVIDTIALVNTKYHWSDEIIINLDKSISYDSFFFLNREFYLKFQSKSKSIIFL